MRKRFPIEADQFPHLHAALEILSHDRGTSAGHPRYYVPLSQQLTARTVDAALGTLTRADLECFVCGEMDEAFGIATRSHQLLIAHEFLQRCFDRWNILEIA